MKDRQAIVLHLEDGSHAHPNLLDEWELCTDLKCPWLKKRKDKENAVDD